MRHLTMRQKNLLGYTTAGSLVVLMLLTTNLKATTPQEAQDAINEAKNVKFNLENADRDLYSHYVSFTNIRNRINSEFTAKRLRMSQMDVQMMTTYLNSANSWYDQSWVDRGKSEQCYNNGNAWLTLAEEQQGINLLTQCVQSAGQAVICYNAGLQWNQIAEDDLDFGWMGLDMAQGILNRYP